MNNSASATQDRIINGALKLFADKGVQNATVRALNDAAGVRHQSAIYYHFGDKWGLVKAVAERSSQLFSQATDEVLQQLEEDAAVAELNVRDVIQTIVQRMFILGESEEGRAHIRFVANLAKDLGDKGQELATYVLRAHVQRLEDLIALALPDVQRDVLEVRMLYSFSGLFHLIATRGVEKHWLNEPSGNIMLEQLVDYFAGGILHNLPAADRQVTAADLKPIGRDFSPEPVMAAA